MAESSRRVLSVDAESLPKHFDPAAAERKWDAVWQASGVYHWDPSRPRRESFVVDTPPPTTSGSLHPGHMFSFTHTDITVRFHRMLGQNVFYPMGWDDNGLATERRVQNYLHVRCDPTAAYEPGLKLAPPDAKARKETPPRNVSRPNFIEACFEVTREDEKTYKELWRRLGLSVDWRQEYQTIDDHCRRIAQLSFRELFEAGHAYTTESPTMWDVDFQTAVAQAELKDVTLSGAFHDIEFAVEGGGRFVIATTRPELLPACVGVTAHPSDERYRALFGKRAITPLFGVPVPIFPSELADPEKGTGILMVCTFGDATDVLWWRENRLALRQLVGRNGRLVPVEFGATGFESRDAAAANRFYGELAGKPVAGARKAIVELLRRPEGSATGNGPPLQGEPRTIEHTVKFYEKGDRPLEFVSTRQWFVRLLDKKAALLEKGAQVAWHPAYMGKRFSDWTENLAHDWGVSRQRYFGVPIPVWYPLDGEGAAQYDRPIVADRDQLPCDPTTDAPKGYTESQRGRPGGFAADVDVFDTWFTSSMTPQISSHWGTDPKRHAALFPADLRPQAHDIIRTWAFYTIAKALLHEGTVPWDHVALSGFVLDPDRKKMSKSIGNVITPMPLVDQYGADAIRYWAGSARLGVDTAVDENVFKVGKRLYTKLFNAGKFVLGQTAEVGPITAELDRAFAAELRGLVERATAHFHAYDEAHALAETESFFWGRFTDTYLELAKTRARGENAADRASAVAALRLGLSVLLRLLAPFQPYITEEVWSWAFAKETGHASIHRAPWPSAADFAGVAAPADPGSLQVAIDALQAIHKAKADGAVSAGREIAQLTLAAEPATLERLRPVLGDVLAAARGGAHRLAAREGAEAGKFAVDDIAFAERPAS